MNCKNCKFFKDNGTGNDYVEQNNGNIGSCTSEKFIEGAEIIKGSYDEIYAVDYEGPYFLVGKNFGCIHFESEKEEIKELSEIEMLKQRVYQLECDLENHINE